MDAAGERPRDDGLSSGQAGGERPGFGPFGAGFTRGGAAGAVLATKDAAGRGAGAAGAAAASTPGAAS